MSACGNLWMTKLESIADDYAASDQMPSDFEDAMKRLIGMGLNREEAANMLMEAAA